MALKDSKFTKSLINKVIKDTIESVIVGNSDSKMVQIDEEWSFYTSGNVLYLFHVRWRSRYPKYENPREKGGSGVSLPSQ